MSELADLLPCDVEVRGHALHITMRGELPPSANWAALICERIPHPVSGILIDMGRLNAPGSSFFAGCLSLLDHFRSPTCTAIVLLNVSDRVVRMLDIMNMRPFFVIRQHP